MLARVAPLRMLVASALPPMTASMASRMIDLPAPVSPVKMFKPGLNPSSSSWMMAKFSIRRLWSMAYFLPSLKPETR